MQGVYPVLFTSTEECILVEVPDLELLTEGKNMFDAVKMARDAIQLKLVVLEDEKAKIPRPTELENIELSKGEFAEEGKTIVSLVDADSEEYRRQLEDCSKFNIKKLKDIIVYKRKKA
ncbi:MAG: type II toxin-antitoxin system HicB family antitoxin [Lachnospiraceae bacterium]|nr:type II toxin-antitoxin system HicB family antitoxin [Lachnospiraceae bacterium]